MLIFILLLSASAVAGRSNTIQIAPGSYLQGRRSLAENELEPVEGEIGSPSTRRNGLDRRYLEEGEGGGDNAKDAVMCPTDMLECPGGTFIERKREHDCEFGECPSNFSENDIVNEDGFSTSDAESQEALVADDETDSSFGIVSEAKIEEGGGGGMVEADENDGNHKEEVITDSTIDEANVLGTAE